MPKVFRLHKQGSALVDWTKSQKYGTDVIDQIEDPSGARADKEITSIPSPFARIDLAKSAFKAIGMGNNSLDGKTAYHKIVSDCLDIGELFFNYNRMSSKIDIIVWDRKKQIDELLNGTPQHQMLGRTLKMYLDQDAKAYNFTNLDRIYLLGYKGNNRHTTLDIIGATSPCTLFFSSANDLTYMSEDLRQNSPDKPFDDQYTPLFKRSPEYQRYLWAIVKSKGETQFAELFPEVLEYFKRNYEKSEEKIKSIIDAVDETTIEDYEPLTINGDTVEVLGMPLRKSKGIDAHQLDSDFKIDSKIYKDILPLALPVEEGNTYSGLKYIVDNWEKTSKAPYVDHSEIVNRTLPASAQHYPYITISDLLQPSIITMPYAMNSSRFFNGNSDRSDRTYLLPLKKAFFDYFTVEDLQGTVSDGKPMIEMKTFAGGSVKVILRIPIQKGYIEYARKYTPDATPDEEMNEGGVIERKFGFGIYPLIDFGSTSQPHYRIAFFNKAKGGKLEFAGKDTVEPKAHVIRREADNGLCSIESFALDSAFNRICVTIGGSTNVVIPKFFKVTNASSFTFAIDFGTTNTHIEYSIDDEPESHPFDISEEEKQLIRLHNDYGNDQDIEDAFEDILLPQTINAGEGYSFPIRTALAEWKQIDYRKQTTSLCHCNIPFRYEKAGIPSYNKVQTDIKWTTGDPGTVKMYLENLFLLLRNKVLMSGGRLADTKIVWFYPVSMSKGHITMFADIWKDLYEKYFGTKTSNNLVRMSESVAPYYYYAKRRGAKSNVVTIDVGGGTTDVFVVADNEPKMLSSFRFAANAIFGDSYNFSVDTNGFVHTFENEILAILQSNQMDELQKVYQAIKRTGRSEDIAAFFFSLKTNKAIKEKDIPMDFLSMLAKNAKMKYVFVVFYGAILYYVATMMKAKGLEMPQTLAFSGNGSRTLRVLSTNNEILAQFASLIFEKVYGIKYGESHKLDVIFDDDPKLATCKGGIAQKSNLSFDKVEELRTSLLGTDTTTFAEGQKYKSIGRQEYEEIAKRVEQFIDFLFELNQENNNFFVNNFVVDGTVGESVKKTCKLDLAEYTTQGYNNKLEELSKWGQNAEAEIEETMFFYPIVPMMNRLAKMLSE